MNARDRQAVDDLLRLASLNGRAYAQQRWLLLTSAAEVERLEANTTNGTRFEISTIPRL